MNLDESAMMFPPAHPTVEYHNAVEFQDYMSTANVSHLDRPPDPAQHRRSGSPSPEEATASESSLDSSDDARVTAMIDAISTSSSSDGDPQEFETARASPASLAEGGITLRVQSPNEDININDSISVPRTPQRSNPGKLKLTYPQTPIQSRPNSGFFVTAVGSPLRKHLTTHSPTYMDVPALMRSRASAAVGHSIAEQTLEPSSTSRLRSPTIRPPMLSYPPASMGKATATGSQERLPVAAPSSTPADAAESRLTDATKVQSSSSFFPEASGSATATLPLERPQGPMISSVSRNSATSRSANGMIRASTLTFPTAALGRTTGATTRSPQSFPVAKSQKLVRFQITNTSMHHQPSMNSPQRSTHETSTSTRGLQNFTQSYHTPTHQFTTFSTLPPHSARPHRGPPNHPIVPVRPRAITKSQAISRAREFMASRQDSTTHSPTRPLPFGAGLTHHEVARQAEAERVRIQEYAARKTAENNPPKSPKGVRREAIAVIRAATNRRLDAQEYAARMAKETETKRTMQAKKTETKRTLQQRAERRMQHIRRVEADVYGTAPQMAEPTRETIEAAQILMQIQQANIANLQSMIRMAEQQVAQQQAAERQAAEFHAAQHRAAGVRAAQRQAASEADHAATRLLYARYGWDLQFEEQRREREHAREEMEKRLNEEWARRNSSTGGFSGRFSGGH